MRRSQIMAARARQAQAQVTTGASEVHTPDSSLLPPFVHKSQIGSHAHATPATSQCDADAAAVSDDASSSSHALTLPRWNIDITKKNHAREERNARAREETELRRARRAERPGGPPSNNHETRYGDENLDGRHMQAGVDAADDDPPLVPLSSPVLGLSDAKRAFLASAKPGTIHSAAATTHTDDTSAASAASLAGVSTHVPAVLPAFSPSKKRPLFPPPSRGSGVVPRRVGPPATAAAAAANAAEKPERYFHAAFCARTTKKHKNYDDGVLIVCGRRCILKNMSAQTIGNTLVSMSTDKFEFEGTYMIGSHEVVLGEVIPDAEYLSGRIFVGASYTLDLSAGGKSAPPTPPKSDAKRQKTTGHALFSKQRLANKPPPGTSKPFDPEAILNDPAMLLLNRDGIIRGENPVMVDAFLSKQLRAHQREGVQFMYDSIMGVRSPGYEGCILADEMGLGKSLQAIAILWTLLNVNPNGKKGVVSKVIIVCPATLVTNWSKEFVKWLGSHRCKPLVLIASLSQADQQQLVQDFIVGCVSNVLIVGYEMLRKHSKELKHVPSPLLICDEGHRLKSTTANQTITALLAIPTKRRIMLTGTPVQNDLGEFFAMCDFVNPSILGNLATFSRTFMQPINRSRDTSSSPREKQLGEARSQELSLRTQSFVLRRSNEILLQYLPEKVEQVLFIPLTTMQAEIYKGLLRGKAIRQVLARTHAVGNDALALQAINSLKKLCNHPGLVYEEAREFGGDDAKSALSFYPPHYVPQSHFGDVAQSSKLAVLDHLLAAVRREGNKIVVVSNYIQTLDMLAVYMQNRQYQFLRLDGQTPAAERSAIVDRFNSSYSTDAFVFLLSAKAGGVGLNLIGGNRLVLFDPDWNPAIDLQAMSRVWRDGQRRAVYIYRFLCTSTIDEKIYQRQIRKQELSLSVMHDHSESVMRNFDSKSLKEVFTYRDATRCETREILARTKKARAKEGDDDDDDLQMMGDFHEDLANALDPILRHLPSHLVSAFLNRVSSLEENQRVLEMMSAREKKRLEKEMGKAACVDHAEEQADSAVQQFDDDSDFELEERKGSDNDAPTTTRAHTTEDDDDDGEMEYGITIATPPLAPVSTTHSRTKTTREEDFDDAPMIISAEEEEEAAAQAEADDAGEEEEEEEEDESPPMPKHGQKRRRRAISDNEDAGEPAESSASSVPPTAVTPTAVIEEDADLPDWMRLAPTPVDSVRAPSAAALALHSAASSIVPSPEPDQPTTGVECEYTLDRIEGGARPTRSTTMRRPPRDEEEEE